MAKYRITSIPQSLPKASNGLNLKKNKQSRKKLNRKNIDLFDVFKKRSDNSIINYTPPSEETMVQGIEPQNDYGFNYNTPALPTEETFPTYEIGPQNYSGPRTPEEEANTFAEPFNWTQGETIPAHDYTYDTRSLLRNPFAETGYRGSLERKLGIPYKGPGTELEQRTIQIPEQFIPDYHAPFTQTGEELKCPQGQIAYKGQCVSEEAYVIIRQREMDQENFTFKKEGEERRKKLQQEITDQRNKNEQVRLQEYADKLNNSKKEDKIDPQYTVRWETLSERVPVFNEDGSVKTDDNGEPITESRLDQAKKSHYVQNNKDGTYSMWPLEIMYKKIVDNGFTQDQFKNYWDIDSDQVKQQLGSVIDLSQAQYDATMSEKILTRALEQRKTIGEVINSLPTKLGLRDQMMKRFEGKLNKVVDDAFAKQVESIIAQQNKEAENNLTQEERDYIIRTGQVLKANPDLSGMTQGFANQQLYPETNKKKFDFEKDGVITYQEKLPSGKYIDKEVYDPIGAYMKFWVDQAPNETERKSRQAKIDKIQKGYQDEYGKVYKEYLDKSGYNQASKQHAEQQDLVHKNIGTDRMRTLSDNMFEDLNAPLKGRAADAASQAMNEKRAKELMKLTNFNDAYTNWVQDKYGDDIRKITQTALKNPDITTQDKLFYLSDLQNKVSTAGTDLFNYTINNKDRGDLGVFQSGPIEDPKWNFDTKEYIPGSGTPRLTYNYALGQLGNLGNIKNRFDYDQKHQLKEGTVRELTFGDKLNDVLSNPFAAFDAWMSPRREMWGNWNMSFEDRKYLAGRDGVDLGTDLGFTPMGVLNNIFNPFNPFMWGSGARQGLNRDGVTGMLKNIGENAIDLALSRATMGLGTGLKPIFAMSKWNPLKYVGGKGSQVATAFVNDYFKKGLPGYLLESPHLFEQAAEDFKHDNYLSGTWNAGLGAIGVLPYLSKTVRALKTGELSPELRALYPEGTSYATDAQSFKNLVRPEYRNIASQLHPDLAGGSDVPFKNLQDLMASGYKNIPFNAGMQTGIITPRYQFGRWSAGKNVFQPKTLEELMQLNYPSSVNRGLQLRKKGGSVELPKADDGRIIKAGMKLLNNPAFSGVKKNWSGAITGIYNPYFKSFDKPLANVNMLNYIGDHTNDMYNYWDILHGTDLFQTEGKQLQIIDSHAYESKSKGIFDEYMRRRNEYLSELDFLKDNDPAYEDLSKQFMDFVHRTPVPIDPSTMQGLDLKTLTRISDESKLIRDLQLENFDHQLDLFNFDKATDLQKINAYKNTPLSYKLFGLSPGYKMLGINHPYGTDVVFPFKTHNQLGQKIYDETGSGYWNKRNLLNEFHPWGSQGEKTLELQNRKENYHSLKKQLVEDIQNINKPNFDFDDDFINYEKDGGSIPRADDGRIIKAGANLLKNVTPIEEATSSLTKFFPNQFLTTSNMGKFANTTGNINLDQLKGALFKEAMGQTHKWPILERQLVKEFGNIPASLSLPEIQRVTNDALLPYLLENNLIGKRDYGLYSERIYFPLEDSHMRRSLGFTDASLLPNRSSPEYRNIASRLYNINNSLNQFQSGAIPYTEYYKTLSDNLGNYTSEQDLISELDKMKYPEKYFHIPMSKRRNVLTGLGDVPGFTYHDNPTNTLAHATSYVDPDTQDIRNITQLQSDAFQGPTHQWKNYIDMISKTKSNIEKHKNMIDLYKTMNEGEVDFLKGDVSMIKDYAGNRLFEPNYIQNRYGDNTNNVMEKVLNDAIKAEESVIKHYENKIVEAKGSRPKQKELLDKNWESVLLQKEFEQAALEGLKKIRIPTGETAAKIQNYQPTPVVTNEVENEIQNIFAEGNFGESIDTPSETKQIFDYDPKHKTVLKRYEKMPKTLKKTFGFTDEQIRQVTDRNGNTWWEVDIPESFLQGKGQIIHKNGGMVMELSQNEIDHYAKDGWIIEDV